MSWKHYTPDGRLKDRGGIIPLTGVVCSAHLSTNQSAAGGGWRKVTIDIKDADPYGWFDAINNRFLPKIAGWYRCSASVNIGAVSGEAVAGIYKNGSLYRSFNDTSANSPNSPGGSTLVYLNGSTDYVELWSFTVAGTAFFNNTQTYFDAELVGASVGFLPGSYPPGPQSGSPAAAGSVPVADGSGSYAWTQGGRGALITKNATQTPASGTGTKVTLGVAELAGDGITTDLANSRLTAVAAGRFRLSGVVDFGAGLNDGINCHVGFQKSGAGSYLRTCSITTGAAGATHRIAAPSMEVQLGAGDYIELFAEMAQGGVTWPASTHSFLCMEPVA